MSNVSESITAISDIGSISYHELQKECGKAGLPATGRIDALRKRLRDHLDSTAVAAPTAVVTTVTSPSEGTNPPAAALPATRDTDDVKPSASAPATIPPAKRKKGAEDHFTDIICPITKVGRIAMSVQNLSTNLLFFFFLILFRLFMFLPFLGVCCGCHSVVSAGTSCCSSHSRRWSHL